MSDETTSKTRKCLFGFKCLGEDPRYPRCTTIGNSEDSALFVSSGDGLNCFYGAHLGNADICTCPTHYSQHSRPDQFRRRTLASDRGEKTDSGQPLNGHKALPTTIEEAVEFLIDDLPMKDKVAIANARAEEVGELTIDLGNHIRNACGLESSNKALLRSCSKSADVEIEHPDDAAAVILARLVMVLVKAHKLRSV